MKKGDRVLNMASGSRGVISGDAMWRLSNSHHSKWAYGVKRIMDSIPHGLLRTL